MRRLAPLVAIVTAVLALLVLRSSGSTGVEAAGLPPLPPGWPSTLEIGQADGPGGAAGMRSVAPFGFRYQYLAGGVNTGNGWATWNANGAFVSHYVAESRAAGIIPAFSYYMILQSSPGGATEASGVASNMRNAATMAAYYADLRLFFQRAKTTSPVVLHVEPDMWGFLQQRASNDDASSVPVAVASSGVAEVAGYPDNLRGFAQAVQHLRDVYAPNVLLGYHISVWGTGVDIALSDPSSAEVDALGARAATFYRSLQADWDLAFSEFRDRDAGFYQHVYGDGGRAWWDANDFARHARFLGRFTELAGERVVVWQIPYGNTRMRAMNNTWGHYQDNFVEWLFEDASRAHLAEYVNAGVIGFWFGQGAGGVTCPCDAIGDGVTDPAPINGNNLESLSADDDGGFFKQQAAAYYQGGAMSLAGGVPVATATPAGPPRGSFTGSAPGRGSIGLLVTGTEANAAGLVAALTAAGCSAETIAVLEGGAWRIYVVGAPAPVNARFPASLAASVPFFVRCAA